MNPLADLYQELVIDHSKRPRNFGGLEAPCESRQGYNPLCGDRLRLDVRVKDGKVEAISFVGEGCAISQASASLMTEAVKGLTVEQARNLFSRMHLLFTEGDASVPTEELGKLSALSGVWEFPSRVKCASLAWHTLRSALEDDGDPSEPAVTE